MWRAVSFEPLSAEAMLEWLTARENVLEAIEDREQRKGDLDDIRSRVGDAKGKLLAELAALGTDVGSLKEVGVSLIIQRADQEQRAHEAVTQTVDRNTIIFALRERS